MCVCLCMCCPLLILSSQFNKKFITVLMKSSWCSQGGKAAVFLWYSSLLVAKLWMQSKKRKHINTTSWTSQIRRSTGQQKCRCINNLRRNAYMWQWTCDHRFTTNGRWSPFCTVTFYGIKKISIKKIGSSFCLGGHFKKIGAVSRSHTCQYNQSINKLSVNLFAFITLYCYLLK